MHYLTIVRVTAADETEAREAAWKMIAPYQETDETNGAWDWAVIGGRYMGFFSIVEGAPVRLGGPGSFDNEATPGGSDVVQLSEIDLEKQRAPCDWVDRLLWKSRNDGATEAEHRDGWMRWLRETKPDEWLVAMDIHC